MEKNVPSPTTPSPAQRAPHAERVRGANGKPYWKLTCFCGKILLAPGDGPQTQGRCPQCGKSLLFPTDRPITTGPLPVIPDRKPASRRTPKRSAPARTPTAPVRPPKRVEAARSSFGRDESSKDRIKLGNSASDITADKLRPTSTRSPRTATGLVKAWPAADRIPRTLAAFIDLTLVLILVAGLLAAGPRLPAHFSSSTFRVAFALIVLWLNEGVLQWFWNGSVGKKLCLIALREAEGESLRIENALLRPFLKVALLPTWPLALRDPNGRTLHDRILNTVVLKGRG